MPVPGWKAQTKAQAIAAGTSPTARKYYDPQGNLRTYRDYLNAKAQHTLDVPTERTAAKIRAAAKAEKVPKDLVQLFRDAFFDDYGNPSPDDRSRGGRLARYLEARGWREKNAPYDVGETPEVRKAA